MQSPDDMLQVVYHLRKTQEGYLQDEKICMSHIEEMLTAQQGLLEQINTHMDSVKYFQTRVRDRRNQMKIAKREAKRLQRKIDKLLNRYYEAVRLEDAETVDINNQK